MRLAVAARLLERQEREQNLGRRLGLWVDLRRLRGAKRDGRACHLGGALHFARADHPAGEDLPASPGRWPNECAAWLPLSSLHKKNGDGACLGRRERVWIDLLLVAVEKVDDASSPLLMQQGSVET